MSSLVFLKYPDGCGSLICNNKFDSPKSIIANLSISSIFVQ